MERVDIGEVERELTRLWREAARPDGDAPAVIRACAINLIVTAREDEQSRISQTLHEVTLRHPCRAVLITEDNERRLPHAWVSMLCHPGGRGQPEICSEQLVLEGAESTMHEMVAAVAGLLVSDLPAVVWWRGAPPATAAETERFDHLAQIADRVLFDSLTYAAAQLARVLELTRSRVVGDLNWSRLTPWRAAVAQCFDLPDRQSLLPAVKKPRVLHPGAAPPASSRLMAGWLRSRLPQSRGVEFGSDVAESVELHTFHIPRPPVPSDAEALADELRIRGRDVIFEQALSAAIHGTM